MPEWRDLILRGDADELASRASVVLGVAVNPSRFMTECRSSMDRTELIAGHPLGVCNTTRWSDDSWWSWLKKRAEAIGAYDRAEIPSLSPDPVSCILHVGFVGVIETDEHIAELLRHPPFKLPDSTARSRIGGTTEIIKPIDSTAARVAPVEE